MKTSISSSLHFHKYFLIGCAVISIVAYLGSGISPGNMQVVAFIALLFSIPILLIHFSKTVEFDENFMYVSSRNSLEEIPFEKIKKVKLAVVKMTNIVLWKIVYVNSEGKERAVRIAPKISDGSFEHFRSTVREKNPNAEVSYQAYAFELDQ